MKFRETSRLLKRGRDNAVLMEHFWQEGGGGWGVRLFCWTMVRSATQLSMVGDFDENFQEFDVCNAISTLAYCFIKVLRSLMGFTRIWRCHHCIRIEIRPVSFSHPGTLWSFLGSEVAHTSSRSAPASTIKHTKRQKINPFLKTQFSNIIKHYPTWGTP